jgi:jumonji domain-containing protein 2
VSVRVPSTRLDSAVLCSITPQFMRHKTSLISPARLREFGVPYSKVRLNQPANGQAECLTLAVLRAQAFQKPGEFVITFPATYHQGFNVGMSCGEQLRMEDAD